MLSNPVAGAAKCKRPSEATRSPQALIPGLLDDIVVTHVLRSELFDDPTDLARLRVVSRGMRDAVAATGLTFEELDEKRAVKLGCLCALQRLALAGRLSRKALLCKAAARSGQLEKLKLLRAGGCPWDWGACYGAAKGGHFEVLQRVRAKGCPLDVETCWGAAEGGHLEVLQWARANGCPWNRFTCSGAAYGGHFEVLQWACASSCPWDELTCWAAARGGHLEVLQWARANGCPWDVGTCVGAAEGGHLELLRWLRANVCPSGLGFWRSRGFDVEALDRMQRKGAP